MTTLLDQSLLVKTLSSLLRQATRFQIASAQVRCSGLSELRKPISECLASGGSGEIWFGVDLATEPEAVRRLIELRDRVSGERSRAGVIPLSNVPA